MLPYSKRTGWTSACCGRLSSDRCRRSRDALGHFVDAHDDLHAADEVDEQIAGDTGAVFTPAAPAREGVGSKGFLGAVPCQGSQSRFPERDRAGLGTPMRRLDRCAQRGSTR